MKLNLLALCFISTLALATSALAGESYVCSHKEQLTDVLEADYPYGEPTAQEVSLDAKGNSSTILGVVHGINLAVNYNEYIPTLLVSVNGVAVQSVGTTSSVSTIVTAGEWTVVVSCEKR